MGLVVTHDGDGEVILVGLASDPDAGRDATQVVAVSVLATVDETDLARDFAGRPEDNVGVLLGVEGRVVVGDADWDLGLSDKAKKRREHYFFWSVREEEE